MGTQNARMRTLLFAGSLLLWPVTAPASQGAKSEDRDLQYVISTYADDLAKLTDDAPALALFTSRLGPALDLKDSVAALAGKPQAPDRTGPKDAVMNEVGKRAVQFTRDLAAWRLALGLLNAAETDPASLERFLRETAPQQAWLTGEDPHRPLREAWQLASVLASVPAPEAGDPVAPLGYRDYAAAVDRASPRFTASVGSWLAIAEREGAQGVLTRLRDIGGLPSASDRAAFSTRYFDERLRPVLNAHLVARAIRAEADAEQQARDQWLQLRSLRDSLREQRGLARLCGTWQWTIHNHQNHGEYKMIMAFPPPGGPPEAGPRPTKTVVFGDTVYLRWEFDRGIVQEDSLLFSGEGQRLEGTFVNSGGAWGGISAKRTSPCSRNGDPPASTSPGGSTSTPPRGRSSPR